MVLGACPLLAGLGRVPHDTIARTKMHKALYSARCEALGRSLVLLKPG